MNFHNTILTTGITNVAEATSFKSFNNLFKENIIDLTLKKKEVYFCLIFHHLTNKSLYFFEKELNEYQEFYHPKLSELFLSIDLRLTLQKQPLSKLNSENITIKELKKHIHFIKSKEVYNTYIFSFKDLKEVIASLVCFEIKENALSNQELFVLKEYVIQSSAILSKLYQKENYEKQIDAFKDCLLLKNLLIEVSNTQEYWDKVIELIKTKLHAYRISIILKNFNTNQFEFVKTLGISSEILEISECLSLSFFLQKVYNSKETLLVENINLLENLPNNKKLRYNNHSFVIVPILVKEEILGFISVTEKENNFFFTNREVYYLENLANQLSNDIRQFETLNLSIQFSKKNYNNYATNNILFKENKITFHYEGFDLQKTHINFFEKNQIKLSNHYYSLLFKNTTWLEKEKEIYKKLFIYLLKKETNITIISQEIENFLKHNHLKEEVINQSKESSFHWLSYFFKISQLAANKKDFSFILSNNITSFVYHFDNGNLSLISQSQPLISNQLLLKEIKFNDLEKGDLLIFISNFNEISNYENLSTKAVNQFINKNYYLSCKNMKNKIIQTFNIKMGFCCIIKI